MPKHYMQWNDVEKFGAGARQFVKLVRSLAPTLRLSEADAVRVVADLLVASYPPILASSYYTAVGRLSHDEVEKVLDAVLPA